MADRRSSWESADLEEMTTADAAKVAGLLHDLDQLAGANCVACSRRICGHEALFSVFMGVKDAPRCLPCLAAALGWAPGDFRDHITEHFRQRDCYTHAWRVASERESQVATWHPPCLCPEETAAPVEVPPALPSSRTPPAPSGEAPPVAHEWDAGDMACGELVLALRVRLRDMPAGAVLRVMARDPAAPEDLPAWCRLTGHRLLAAEHPEYLIQRKEP